MAAETVLAGLGVSRPSVLFLLGHMRSGSTLLLHLLLTNSDCGSVGERNLGYESEADLARFALAVRARSRSPLRRLRYVIDQVNHNRFTPNPALLASRRVRLVFVLREPESTLASLLELSRAYYGDSWTIAQAIGYYVARLEGLMELASRLEKGAPVALVNYETLTADPQPVLEDLRAFLGLGAGFSTTYPRHDFTSTRGDPGPRIATGTVLPANHPRVPSLASADLANVRAVFTRCRETLTRIAASVSC